MDFHLKHRGLIELFLTMTAEASSPVHPARTFIQRRYTDTYAGFVRHLREARESGEVHLAEDEIAYEARLLMAVMDGLELQWLIDPSVDLTRLFNRCLDDASAAGRRRAIAERIFHPRPAHAVAPALSLDPWTGSGDAWFRSKLIMVWLGGHAGAAGLPSVSTVSGSSGWGRCGPGGRVQAATGGGRPSPRTRSHKVSQGLAQGQCAGRCRTGRRWGRASRAGTLTMVRRRVAPRATAWAGPARVPAARSRLWVIAAHSAQAAFAANRPEGRCARGPSIRSANTVSMIACRRWVMSAAGGRLGAVGEERVVPPDREQLIEAGAVADPAHDQPGGDRVLGGGERGEHRYLGDLGVGDQLTGVGIGHRAGIVDRGPGVVGDGWRSPWSPPGS